MNSSINTIEWLAEENKKPVDDGDLIAVHDFQGNEIARGEFTYTGGSGWVATGEVEGIEFQTWLVLPNETVWIDTEGHLVYFRHVAGEQPLPESI